MRPPRTFGNGETRLKRLGLQRHYGLILMTILRSLDGVRNGIRHD
jgi:hypothetical protein